MILFKKGKDLRNWLKTGSSNDQTIGFVPTMGALHEGHLSLIRTSRSQCDITICSIFVNPTQFNQLSDYQKYPVTIENDIDLLEETGCDALFLPSVEEMYPDGISHNNKEIYAVGELETILEGKFRPGHYQGVCIIVHRLLELVRPHFIYLGQKDYQQCLVITKLIELTGMTDRTRIVVCPTLREKSGLAMSSRNVRLTAEQRRTASEIHDTLEWIRNQIKPGSHTHELVAVATGRLEKAGLKPEYVEIARSSDLSHVDKWSGKDELAVLTAAWMGDVRLIDNILIKPLE